MDSSLHSPENAILIDLLRDRRRALGMRQADLAHELGVQQTFVSKYEIGERRLDLVQLRQICAALHTDLPEFVTSFEDRLRAAKARRRGDRNSG